MPMKIYRLSLLLLAVVLLIAEIAFVLRYLPTVQEPIETFGAGVLLCGSTLLLAALWIPTMRSRYKWLAFIISLGLALWLLLMAYAFMVRW